MPMAIPPSVLLLLMPDGIHEIQLLPWSVSCWSVGWDFPCTATTPTTSPPHELCEKIISVVLFMFTNWFIHGPAPLLSPFLPIALWLSLSKFILTDMHSARIVYLSIFASVSLYRISAVASVSNLLASDARSNQEMAMPMGLVIILQCYMVKEMFYVV